MEPVHTVGGLGHPVFPFVVALVATAIGGHALRRWVALAAPVASMLLLLRLPEGASLTHTLYGFDLILLRWDPLAALFAWAFVGYGLLAAVYAWTDTERGTRLAQLGVVGAGVLVVLAGDLLTLFLGWEWLTVTSLFLIWQGRRDASYAAGLRYLALHLFGATLLLSGILLRLSVHGVGFDALWDGGLAGGLILAGVLINAAVPPLHAWLPDAYPRASIFGSVFLAAFTTKAAVYALLRGFAGLDLLIPLGAVMTLVGVGFALRQDNMRRLLAYHIVSQVGYMVTGVGLGTALALNGSAAHAFAHIFYKGLLLMGAGAVLHATGREDLSALGGMGRPLRLVALLTVIGAAAISGVPLLSGFVSKSMIASAAGDIDQWTVFAVLQLAAAGTFLSVGLKLSWFAFGGAPRGAPVMRPVPTSMIVAMVGAALVSLVTGLWPDGTLYPALPFAHRYAPFTVGHLLESAGVLGVTAVVFWRLRSRMMPQPIEVTDVDVLYRRPLAALVHALGGLFEWWGRRASRSGERTIAALWRRLEAYGEAHRNPTVSLQITAIVFTLLALVLVGTLVTR